MNKTKANSISIKQSSGSYTVTVKQGRKTFVYDLASKNAARSFVRRNFAQMGSYL